MGIVLLPCEMIQEAPDPVGVGALGAVGVVPGSDVSPQLFQGGQRVRPALLVDDGAGRTPFPVRLAQEVDEIGPNGLFSLTHLPVLEAAAPFQILAESPHLV